MPKRKIAVGLFLGFLLLVLGSGFGTLRAGAKLPPCEGCHGTLIEKDLAGLVIHKPFLEKKCPVCHCRTEAVAEGDKGKGKPPVPQQVAAVGENPDLEFKELDSHLFNAVSHAFFLSPERLQAGELLVELWDGSERRGIERVKIPAFSAMTVIEDDGSSPVITSIRMERADFGLYSRARISWRTDRPATSDLDFGKLRPRPVFRAHRDLVFNHQVMITRLKPGRSYKFELLSKDCFGHLARHPITLPAETRIKLASPEPGAVGDGAEPGAGEARLTSCRFFRIGKRCLAVMELSRSLSVSVGIEVARETPRPVVMSKTGEDAGKTEAEIAAGPAAADTGRMKPETSPEGKFPR
ncbi:MAG: hypothetical protein GXO34_08770, partial [Deltaproteobacteria bacterium]|nr:hypothetical protein [Deltaproteobacteria bacterium]